MTPFDLTGQVAVVTGVFGKLGKIWAESLLAAGAVVAGIDLEGIALTADLDSLQKKVGKDRLCFYRASVSDKKQLVRALDSIEKDFQSPSILVNNAGIDQPPGPVQSFRLEDIPGELCEKILDVNLLGAFYCMQVFGAAMLKKGKGAIVNIGSMYASVSPDERMYDHIPSDPPFLKPPFYGASKSALINLTSYFAAHWGPKGIRVNTLSPGAVLGQQDPTFKSKINSKIPLGRMAESKDLVGPLLFLVSDASSYTTGANLNVDGGYTIW